MGSISTASRIFEVLAPVDKPPERFATRGFCPARIGPPSRRSFAGQGDVDKALGWRILRNHCRGPSLLRARVFSLADASVSPCSSVAGFASSFKGDRRS